MDIGRLKRAQQIRDAEVNIQLETNDEIHAMVKEYHIVIDLKNHIIMHDSANWSKMLPTKKLCKHVGKLLLTINKVKATAILRQIYSNKELWEFKPYTQQEM